MVVYILDLSKDQILILTLSDLLDASPALCHCVIHLT